MEFSVIVWSILVLVVVLAAKLFLSHLKIVKIIDRIQGPKAFPIIGNLLEVYGNNEVFFRNIVAILKKHRGEGVTRIWIATKPYVVTHRASEAEAVLSNTKNITKNVDYDFLVPWIGTGLLTSTGSKWHSRRKLLTPAFHFRILEDFVDVMNEETEVFVEKLKQHVGVTSGVDLFPLVTLCTLDIICASAMGVRMRAQDKSDSDYVKSILRISNILVEIMISPWYWNPILLSFTSLGKEHNKCVETLHKFTSKVINNRIKEVASKPAEVEHVSDEAMYGTKRRVPFLDLLISASAGGTVLNEQDIREEVDTFMFEGHDTTSAGVFWSLFHLACNPECQRKAQEELDSIFGSSDRMPTSQDLKEMKYLECAIKESQRLNPSVPVIARKLSEGMHIGEYYIPEGVSVLVHIYMLHRDPKVFPDPERFDPDRFTPENSAGRHAYSYVPFSAGLRNCIGQKFAMMEEKIMVSSVLRNFNLTSLVKPGEVRLAQELILRPVNKLLVRIDKRS